MIKQKLKIDDSLDVFPVHGVGGIIGTLLAGILSSPLLGIFSGQGHAPGIESIGAQFQVQLIGVLATGAYAGTLTWGLLKLVSLVTPLRVSKDDETEGLDLVLHEERGYNL